jgi:hypothetical protein
MPSLLPSDMRPHTPPLSTEQARRRAVLFALRLTRNTALAPRPFERSLLDRFVRGEMSLDQVLDCLEDEGRGQP